MSKDTEQKVFVIPRSKPIAIPGKRIVEPWPNNDVPDKYDVHKVRRKKLLEMISEKNYEGMSL